MLVALLLAGWILKIKKDEKKYLVAFITMLSISCYYFFSIGLIRPSSPANHDNITLPILVVISCVLLYICYKKNSLIVILVIIALTAFAGLIPEGRTSLSDLEYITGPALRLMHGFKTSEIYFQYDLFLSYLAFGCMKLKLALEWFPYLGQISFFLFFIGAFFFSERFFLSKGLFIFFIFALMLVRYYTGAANNSGIFQVTPLRLDLWIILLLAINKKGINHWLLGVCIGLLVLFHRNLGLIYLFSYVELIMTLFLLDIFSLIKEKKANIRELFSALQKHIRLNAINSIIIAISILLCFVLFHELFSKSAIVIRKIGIGMLPISKVSLYWYIPVLLNCIICFLFFYQEKLGRKYTTTALFVVFLAIGNSMYFFGRSHENNILNISGILVLALFILFDILIYLSTTSKKTSEKTTYITRNRVYWSMPVLFIFLVTYYYSESIVNKINTQYTNLIKSNFHYPILPVPAEMVASIKQITHNSSKVYFMDFFYDFYYYYYCKYSPVGYYSPPGGCVFKKDIINLLQDLLNKHYYLVYNNRNHSSFNDDTTLISNNKSYISEYLPYLRYNRSSEHGDMVAVSKEDILLILPETSTSLYHVGIKDSLATVGLEYGGLQLIDSFSIEILMKPIGEQLPNATIINNLSNSKGFTLKLEDSTQSKYLFSFGNGTFTMPSATFDLENNKWHYVIIMVNEKFLIVYDNGKLVSIVNLNGLPIINSEIPLTIGNLANGNNRYRGLIREVKISNGNLNEKDIVKNAEKIYTELNR